MKVSLYDTLDLLLAKMLQNVQVVALVIGVRCTK